MNFQLRSMNVEQEPEHSHSCFFFVLYRKHSTLYFIISFFSPFLQLPEVRSSCAKALGAMVQGVGEEELSKVLPWLLKTLQSEATPVDRSGAAQGISEVLKTQVRRLKLCLLVV